jgi:hypothetical protein
VLTKLAIKINKSSPHPPTPPGPHQLELLPRRFLGDSGGGSVGPGAGAGRFNPAVCWRVTLAEVEETSVVAPLATIRRRDVKGLESAGAGTGVEAGADAVDAAEGRPLPPPQSLTGFFRGRPGPRFPITTAGEVRGVGSLAKVTCPRTAGVDDEEDAEDGAARAGAEARDARLDDAKRTSS